MIDTETFPTKLHLNHDLKLLHKVWTLELDIE